MCAMCVWGQALVLGPNINLPMDRPTRRRRTALAQKAQSLRGNAKPVDRALIEALAAALRRSRARRSQGARQARTPMRWRRSSRDYPGRRRRAGDVRRSADGPHAVGLTGRPTASRTRITPKIVGAIETRAQAQSATHRRDPLLHPRGRSVRRPRARRGATPTRSATRAGLGPPRAHARAHLHPHRPLQRCDARRTSRASTADKDFLAVCKGSNGMYPLGYVPHNWHFATLSAGLHGLAHAGAGSRRGADRAARAT